MTALVIKCIIFAFVGYILSIVLNPLIQKLPREENIFTFERCSECRAEVGFLRKIPIFSYIFCKGRYFCGHKIPVRCLIVEIANTVLWVVAALVGARFGILYSVITASARSVFLVVFFTDLETMIIPDSMALTLVVLAILTLFTKDNVGIVSRVLAAVVTAIIFLAVYYISERIFGREAFGGGDVKLLIATAFLIGGKAMVAGLFFSAVPAAIILVTVRAINNKKGKKNQREYPFGPFLSVGMSLGMLFGTDLINMYMSLFL